MCILVAGWLKAAHSRGAHVVLTGHALYKSVLGCRVDVTLMQARQGGQWVSAYPGIVSSTLPPLILPLPRPLLCRLYCCDHAHHPQQEGHKARRIRDCGRCFCLEHPHAAGQGAGHASGHVLQEQQVRIDGCGYSGGWRLLRCRGRRRRHCCGGATHGGGILCGHARSHMTAKQLASTQGTVLSTLSVVTPPPLQD